MKKENTNIFLVFRKGSSTVFSLTLPRKKIKRYFTKKAINKPIFYYQEYMMYNLTLVYENSKGLRKELDKRFTKIAEQGNYIVPSHYWGAIKFVDMYKALKERRKVAIVPNNSKEEYIRDILIVLSNISTFKDGKDTRQYNRLFSVIALFRDGLTDIKVGKNVSKDSINNTNYVPIVPIDEGFLEIIAAQV